MLRHLAVLFFMASASVAPAANQPVIGTIQYQQQYHGPSVCSGPAEAFGDPAEVPLICSLENILRGIVVVFDFGSPQPIGAFRHNLLQGEDFVSPNVLEQISFYNSETAVSTAPLFLHGHLADAAFDVSTLDEDGLSLQFEPVVARYAVWRAFAPETIQQHDGQMTSRFGYVHANTEGIQFFAVPEPTGRLGVVLALAWVGLMGRSRHLQRCVPRREF